LCRSGSACTAATRFGKDIHGQVDSDAFAEDAKAHGRDFNPLFVRHLAAVTKGCQASLLAANNDLVEKIGGTTCDHHRGLCPSQPGRVRMTHRPKPEFLLTGVGGGYSSVSRLVAEILISRGESVRAMVHHDDGRFDALRELGAEIVAGDLTNPGDVAAAMSGINRVFFNMSVSADYLEAAAILTALARNREDLEVLVNMSQMTVSEMTATSTAESRHQRLHWLSEHIMNWSGVPVVHVRPTVFLDNPLFTILASQSVTERGLLALPFGRGRTSPIAATDVARVIATILADPAHRRHAYDLTGPTVLDIDGLAEQYTQGLGRPVAGVDLPYDDFVKMIHAVSGISPHIVQHLLTVAKLHRDDRYNRLTDDVEQVTGHPPQTVAQYIAAHRDLFASPSLTAG
jgi:uncharacterized protein YbjT (DUF2867 family)